MRWTASGCPRPPDALPYAAVMVPIGQLLLEFDGEETFLSSQGTRSGLLVLLGMLGSFVVIRTSTRLIRSQRFGWWPSNIETGGGLHLHHMVFGIVLLLLCGFVLALQPVSPFNELVAAGFGIGAGLTLDEFALWLHVEDVYWAEEGRRSIDALVIASLVAGLVLLGFVPVSKGDSIDNIVITLAVNFFFSAIAVVKGKVFMGVVGVLVPLVGLIGAIRLAKPGSPWAVRRYKEGSKKLAKAERRYEAHTRRYRRFQDEIAGAPSIAAPAAQAEIERPPV